MLLKGSQKKTLILCAREIQNSIKQSVHRLLKAQIPMIGLSKFYDVTDGAITGANGTEFFFEGLLRNVDKIKSFEDIDICWVEEAHNVSAESWEVLTPTIRKPDSEIWVSFNPKYEDDETYQRFAVNPPDNCISRLVNYSDNPFFPEVLRIEMEQDRARDKVLHDQKWLGKPVGMGGKIFPAFDRDIHVKHFDRELIAKKGNCFMAMDPHSHYYPFCTWLALIPKNSRGNWPEDFYKHVYAEWPTFDDLGGYYHDMRKKLFYKGALKDLAREIYAKDGIEFGINIIERYIDSRYAKGSGSWNWSTSTEGVVELFAKEENGGLQFKMPFEKVMDAQKEAIHADMLYNTLVPLNAYNEPSFSVDPACRNTIAALRNHRLEEDSERESEKYKEPPDTIRINYAGIIDFKYKKPGESETKLQFGGGLFGEKYGWMG